MPGHTLRQSRKHNYYLTFFNLPRPAATATAATAATATAATATA